jgi:hypothetical protein
VTDTGVPAQTNTFITHLNEVEVFLRKDADICRRAAPQTARCKLMPSARQGIASPADSPRWWLSLSELFMVKPNLR